MEVKHTDRVEIPGLNGYYIDINGIVYHGDKIKEPFYYHGKRTYVNICKNNKISRYHIGKLLAMAYLGANASDVVCYKDKDNTNITLDNIYIGTKSQSLKDAYTFQKENNLFNDKRILKKYSEDKSTVFKLDPETNSLLTTYPNAIVASREMDVPVSLITDCCVNPNKTCCHFKWSFDFNYGSRD